MLEQALEEKEKVLGILDILYSQPNDPECARLIGYWQQRLGEIESEERVSQDKKPNKPILKWSGSSEDSTATLGSLLENLNNVVKSELDECKKAGRDCDSCPIKQLCDRIKETL